MTEHTVPISNTQATPCTMAELAKNPIPGNLDFNILQAIHEKLFSDIAYEDMNGEDLLDADIKSFEGDPVPLMKLIEKHIVEFK